MTRIVAAVLLSSALLVGPEAARAEPTSEPEAAEPVADESRRETDFGVDSAATPDWKDVVATVNGGDCGKALPMLDAYVKSNPEAATAFYFTGYCHGVQGRDDDAIVALERVLAIDPTFSGVSVMRGKILARKGRTAEAEQAFMDEIGHSEAPELRLEAWTALAGLYGQAKQDDKAKEAWGKVIELSPLRADAYAEVSAIELRAGDLERADAILEQGEAAGASNPTARLNVGIAYFNKKDTQRAEEVFLKVCETGPTAKARAAAYGLLAKAQLRESKKVEAMVSIRRSLELDPNGPMAGELRDMLKDLEKAMRGKR